MESVENQISAFHKGRMNGESFPLPETLSIEERKQAKLFAEKLGLEATSFGTGDERRMHIIRPRQSLTTVSTDGESFLKAKSKEENTVYGVKNTFIHVKSGRLGAGDGDDDDSDDDPLERACHTMPTGGLTEALARERAELTYDMEPLKKNSMIEEQSSALSPSANTSVSGSTKNKYMTPILVSKVPLTLTNHTPSSQGSTNMLHNPLQTQSDPPSPALASNATINTAKGLYFGAHVALTNLMKGEYNGITGIIENYDSSTHRYTVKFDVEPDTNEIEVWQGAKVPSRNLMLATTTGIRSKEEIQRKLPPPLHMINGNGNNVTSQTQEWLGVHASPKSHAPVFLPDVRGNSPINTSQSGITPTSVASGTPAAPPPSIPAAQAIQHANVIRAQKDRTGLMKAGTVKLNLSSLVGTNGSSPTPAAKKNKSSLELDSLVPTPGGKKKKSTNKNTNKNNPARQSGLTISDFGLNGKHIPGRNSQDDDASSNRSNEISIYPDSIKGLHKDSMIEGDKFEFKKKEDA